MASLLDDFGSLLRHCEGKRTGVLQVPKDGRLPRQSYRCDPCYAVTVYWILATVFILVALAVPRLRPIGIVGCIILGAMLAWGVLQRLRGSDGTQEIKVQQRGRPTSPAAILRNIPPQRLVVDHLQLVGSGAPFEFRGRIENRSDALLKSVTILVTRRDCFEGALDPTGCAVLWQDRHWVSVSIPPEEARDFSSSVWMRGGAPGARGTIKDSFEVVAAAGEIALPAAAP